MTMTTKLALLSTLLLPAAAVAQPAGTPVPPPTPPPTASPTTPPPSPVYSPTPTGPTTPTPPPLPQAAQTTQSSSPSASARPDGLTLGLGLSYLLGGAEINRPSGASARLRFGSGLTFEPFVRLATHGQSTMNDDIKNAQNELLLGSNVRLPLAGRGKVDIIAHAGAGVTLVSDDPDGSDNNNTTTSFMVDYGLGVEYWYSANWCLGFTARNRVLEMEIRSFEISDEATETDTDFGLIWSPEIELSLHLYY